MKPEQLQRSRRLVIYLGVVPLLLAVFAYQTTSRYVDSVEGMLRTDLLVRTLDELFFAVQDAETGQRGYLLTGEPLYLAPFEKAKQRIGGKLVELKAMAQSNPVQRKGVEDLASTVALKMSELEETIRLKRESSLAAALAEVHTNRGQGYMDRIRSLVSQLRQQQTQALAWRVESTRRSQRQLELVLAIGVGTAFLLLFLSYRFLVLYSRERDQVELTIRNLNSALEARVKERTAELETQTKELEKRSAELARSNADLVQFAYVASHDLQEPLRMVGSYVGLLARRYRGRLDENADQYMQFAIDGANRMQALIQDLLAYSQAGTQALKKAPVPFSRVLEVVTNNLSIAIKESSATIRANSLPVVLGDESKLVLVLQNLVANAIKFHKPGMAPEINVTAHRRSDEWVLEVSDNGIGFDPKYSERIFQVFQRLHGVGKYPGNGIGLAISRRIVEHHGGRLWAESEPGKGATFFFTLPVATDRAALESDWRAQTERSCAEPVSHASP
jgi:signal transduction histidine kinase